MIVIPAINETSFFEIEKKIKKSSEMGSEWVHLDVSDGKFTENELWNNPSDLLNIKGQLSNVKIEAHLMVENPDAIVSDWIDAGVRRIIVHAEAVKDLQAIKDKCRHFDVELFIAGNPDTPVEKFLEYKGSVDGFLVLAVKPGKAGQKFGENQLEKIKLLREQVPNDKIMVDGGVNEKNASQIRQAGADMLVAASAIWGNADPAGAYRKLIEL